MQQSFIYCIIGYLANIAIIDASLAIYIPFRN